MSVPTEVLTSVGVARGLLGTLIISATLAAGGRVSGVLGGKQVPSSSVVRGRQRSVGTEILRSVATVTLKSITIAMVTAAHGEAECLCRALGPVAYDVLTCWPTYISRY